jgi:hypothetical protein
MKLDRLGCRWLLVAAAAVLGACGDDSGSSGDSKAPIGGGVVAEFSLPETGRLIGGDDGFVFVGSPVGSTVGVDGARRSGSVRVAPVTAAGKVEPSVTLEDTAAVLDAFQTESGWVIAATDCLTDSGVSCSVERAYRLVWIGHEGNITREWGYAPRSSSLVDVVGDTPLVLSSTTDVFRLMTPPETGSDGEMVELFVSSASTPSADVVTGYAGGEKPRETGGLVSAWVAGATKGTANTAGPVVRVLEYSDANASQATLSSFRVVDGKAQEREEVLIPRVDMSDVICENDLVTALGYSKEEGAVGWMLDLGEGSPVWAELNLGISAGRFPIVSSARGSSALVVSQSGNQSVPPVSVEGMGGPSDGVGVADESVLVTTDGRMTRVPSVPGVSLTVSGSLVAAVTYARGAKDDESTSITITEQ